MDIEHHSDDLNSDKGIVHSYDEAVEKTGHGKFHALLLLACGLCLMSVIVETLNIGFVIPMIESECEMKLTLSDKGLLNGAAFAGVVISSHFWGFLADTWGRKKVMHLCSTISFIFSALSSFSANVWMLIITRFFVGFFVSGIAANTYAYLGEFHSEKNRARALSFAGVFMAFALTFCPGVAWLILQSKDIATISFNIPILNINFGIWRIFLLLCASLSGFIIVLMSFLPESPKFLLVQEHHDEALKVLEKIYKWNNKTSSAYPVSKIDLNEMLLKKPSTKPAFMKLVWEQTSPLFKSPLLFNTTRTSFVMFSLFAASSGFFMWVPDILAKLLDYKAQNLSVCGVIAEIIGQKNMNSSSVPVDCLTNPVDSMVYQITFFMGAFFSVIYFLNGVIINKTGKKNLLTLWFVICGFCGILIPWTSDYYWILTLMVGFLTVGVCGSILSAIVVDLFPTNVRAMALCLILMIGRLGAMAGSIFVAYLIVRSCELMFALFGGLLLISAVISFLLPGN
ncbi:unnamed protein product [Diamesa tonsa]